MKAILEQTPNLDVKQATVSRVVIEAGAVIGVETDMGVAIAAQHRRDHVRDILARALACRRE